MPDVEEQNQIDLGKVEVKTPLSRAEAVMARRLADIEDRISRESEADASR